MKRRTRLEICDEMPNQIEMFEVSKKSRNRNKENIIVDPWSGLLVCVCVWSERAAR